MSEFSLNGRTAWRPLLIGAICLVALVILAFWGGMPRASQMPTFIAGLAVVLLLNGAVALAGWYLLFRPIPASADKADRTASSPLTRAHRQVMGLLLVVGTLLESIGGVWDEVWHNKYGIPFGEDFFWRPHILIYIGLGTIVMLAGVAWWALVVRGKGSLVQRFRADPLTGLLVLLGVVFLYSIPADPIWHAIYGSDLSAFSLPHVLLSFMTVLALVVGTGLYVSTLPARSWQGIWRFTIHDAVPILAGVGGMASIMLLLTADYFSLSAEQAARGVGLVFQRPDWVLPVFIAFGGTYFGALTTLTLRRYGAATVVALLTIALRLVLVNALQHDLRDANSWLLCLPPMLAIDLVAWWRARENKPMAWWMPGLAAAVAVIVGSLPLMHNLFAYPKVTAGSLPGMAITGLITALVTSWIASLIGNYLATQNKVAEPAQAADTLRLRWLLPVVLAVTTLFMVWFVATATPPVG